jgi:Janus/Ocnus family (Ocnus).
MGPHPKFIIAGDARKRKGYLRMGMVQMHRDLREGYEKIWGGGWWARNDEAKTITLYGSSTDFGAADFRFMNQIDRELRDYTFVYTPVPGLPGNVLDTSEVEWI